MAEANDSRLAQALATAQRLHGAQKRKGTEIPYVAHLLAVAAFVLEGGGDEDAAVAALLHDAVEDAGGPPTFAAIRAQFAERVAAQAHGGHLTPDNVRLAHRLCNRRDYTWRMKINALLGKRMSLEEIAETLNAEKVPTIHGTNRWTSASVRKAFVS